MYVANTSDKDVSIPIGTFLCGSGKGTFALNTQGSFNPDCHHMYTINNCNDFVCTTKMGRVVDLVADQRSNNPETKFADHTMKDFASKEKDAFSITQDHEIYFILAFASDDSSGQKQHLSQMNLAGMLPATTFESSHSVVATWAVKWAPQGLSLVRPMVLFKQSCDLPAGKALPLM